MKKNIVSVVILVFVLVFIVIGSFWVSSYNGAVKLENEIVEKETNIFSAYSNRFDKVTAFIDAIEGANEQIITQINAIKEARIAFADAIASNNLELAESETATIESTFINLISYMEDNPTSWNTISLTQDFMSEFSASTNAVTYSIDNYNKTIKEYNNFISVFPNNLFTSKFEKNTKQYIAPNFNTELPKFN